MTFYDNAPAIDHHPVAFGLCLAKMISQHHDLLIDWLGIRAGYHHVSPSLRRANIIAYGKLHPCPVLHVRSQHLRTHAIGVLISSAS